MSQFTDVIWPPMQMPASAPGAPTNVSYTPAAPPPNTTVYQSPAVTAQATREAQQIVLCPEDTPPGSTTLVFPDGTSTTLLKEPV